MCFIWFLLSKYVVTVPGKKTFVVFRMFFLSETWRCLRWMLLYFDRKLHIFSWIRISCCMIFVIFSVSSFIQKRPYTFAITQPRKKLTSKLSFQKRFVLRHWFFSFPRFGFRVNNDKQRKVANNSKACTSTKVYLINNNLLRAAKCETCCTVRFPF